MKSSLNNEKIILKNRPNPEVNESLFELIFEGVRELVSNEILVVFIFTIIRSTHA